MGLLDDAIREHLELKRRRGGDPEAIARMEREALSPARREPEAEPEPVADVPPEAQAIAPTAPAEPAEPLPDEEEHWLDEEDEEDAEEPAGPPEPPPAAGLETQEYRLQDEVVAEDDVVPADEEEEDEDVLEETPEFLEDAPDHDRLWFEQKPPRDFDF